MAAAEARGGEGWREAPLTVPRALGKLPRPGKRGRDPRARQSATRRHAASRPADTPAPTWAPRAAPCPWPLPLPLLAARPARSPQSPPAPCTRGARPAHPASGAPLSRPAEVPRTRWPGPRCPSGPRPLPAWPPCGGIRVAGGRAWGARVTGPLCGRGRDVCGWRGRSAEKPVGKCDLRIGGERKGAEG